MVRLLTAGLSGSDADAALGDLEEEYRSRLAHGESRTQLNLWYVRQAAGAVRHLRKLERSDAGGRRRGVGMEGWTMDARYAARGLVKRWTMSLAVIATLALGIGVNVAIFTVADAVVFEDLPYEEPHELVRVWPATLFYTNRAQTSWINERTTVFQEVAGWGRATFTFENGADIQEVRGGRVHWNHFRMLGVEPALGRAFRPSDTSGTASDIVVISWALWQDRWGGDPDVIGRDVIVSGSPHTVVGVLPRWHQPTEEDWEVWGPINMDEGHPHSGNAMAFNARLREGASIDQARDEMRALFAEYETDVRGRALDDETRAAIDVVSLRAFVTGDADRLLLPALFAVALILVIACGNLSSLLLAHGRARSREMAVRRALGAGSSRLGRMVLTEGVLLGGVGGIAGIVVATGLLTTFEAALPDILPRARGIQLDTGVLLFAIGATVTATLLSWATPVLQSRRQAPATLLRSSAAAATGSRRPAGRVLVAGQVALSVVLVGGATLTLRSYATLLSEDPGFEPDAVVTFRPRFPSGAYSFEEQLALQDRIGEALMGTPGVVSVGATSLMPMHSGGAYSRFRQPGQGPEDEVTVSFRNITPGYLETMEIELIAGRDIGLGDRQGSEMVALLNQTAARESFGTQDPVGRVIELGGSGTEVRVVGVIGDVRQTDLAEASMPEVYLSFPQSPTSRRAWAVRVTGDPTDALERIAAAVRSIDPAIGLLDFSPLNGVLARSVRRARFFTLLLSLFGATALALGAVGVWGVTAHQVRLARRALGIRLALGASGSEVARRIGRDGLAPVAVGTLTGLGVFWFTAQLFEGMLYGVGSHDPATFLVVPLVLLAVGAASVLGPALHTRSLDPASILREE